MAAAAGAHANILWTTLARALSFAIPLVSARVFGATPETDAFFLALGAVTFFVSVGGVVLEQAVVPHAASLTGQSDLASRWFRSLARWAGVLGLGLAAIAALAILVAERVQPRAELRSMVGAIETLGIALIPALVIVGSLGAGVLTGRGKYPVVCAGMALRAVGIVLVMVVRPFRATIPDLTTAFLLGEGVRAFFNLSLAQRALRGGAPGGAGADAVIPSVQAVWATTWPIAVSMAAAALSPIVDRVVAAGVIAGGVSVVEYGEKAYFAVVGTVVTGLQVTVFTRWTRSEAGRRDLWRELRALALIGGAAAVAAAPLVYRAGSLMARLVVGGAFLRVHAEALGLIGFYFVAILPYTVGGFAVRALIAIDATRPLIWLGLVKVSTNVVGDIVLSRAFGLPGIALATIAAESLVAILGVAVARAKLRAAGAKGG
jgi:putative peptidoglycan lipid II flippase